MPHLLVIAEHDDGQLKQATLSAVGFARQVSAEAGGAFEVLVIGQGVSGIAESLRGYGATTVLIADSPALQHPVADKYAQVIADVVRERHATMVVAAASTFSKDILPRAAALLDAGMLSDVIAVSLSPPSPLLGKEGTEEAGEDFIFKRVMFAGNVIATVRLDGAVKVLTVRPAAFAPPEKVDPPSPLVPVAVDETKLPAHITYEGRAAKVAGRPDSTEARVVVSGGRAIKSAEDFERLIGGLADVLGGAVGCSRALVDAGITPNELQVGQTGKIVAPDLYIAVGISGAIQHLAGMKDAKVIVAINKDPDAPIFEVADYGLVGDAYQIVPALIERLKQTDR
ncbi:MAG: electron transfer flavoprotein subunit alpha/FixB family protein [Abditibacteriales bacterium]|nr:electron transfer flavoprotein subunit alpha/FixB family protein [Abditibacteriales bacterium]MDW8367014.1 electron transfer flavoprotein subunit alpha/FixB family protein [Abditibacteriales bacterium]